MYHGTDDTETRHKKFLDYIAYLNYSIGGKRYEAGFYDGKQHQEKLDKDNQEMFDYMDEIQNKHKEAFTEKDLTYEIKEAMDGWVELKSSLMHRSLEYVVGFEYDYVSCFRVQHKTRGILKPSFMYLTDAIDFIEEDIKKNSDAV